MVTINYYGTTNFMEQPYTGRIALWSPGEKQTVSDSIASTLLALNVGFQVEADGNGEPVTYSVDPLTGRVELFGADTYALTKKQFFGVEQGSPQLSGYGDKCLTRKPNIFADFRNIASLTVAAWTGATGTLEVSRDYLYNGLPMLKVTMPAACTRVELGVSSGVTLPTDYFDSFSCPIYLPDKTDFGVSQIYLGDATYTAYQLNTTDISAAGVAGWNHLRWDNRATSINEPTSTNPGTINSGNVAQCKLRVNKSSGAASRIFYVAFLQDLPKHRAKILFTADDGYDEWYSWLKDQAILYGVPWALGIDKGYVGTNGFMTAQQITEMASNPLFEFYSHGKSNQGYTDVGASGYYANLIECGEYLKSIGVSDPYSYHPYVKGQRGDDLDPYMIAAGVKIARLATGVVGETYKPAIMDYMYGSSAAIKARIGLSLESSVTLSAAKTAIDNACAAGGVLNIMAHEFVSSGAASLQWTYADTIALMAYAKQKEAQGFCDVVKASELAVII